jgi:hypothetical protein
MFISLKDYDSEILTKTQKKIVEDLSDFGITYWDKVCVPATNLTMTYCNSELGTTKSVLSDSIGNYFDIEHVLTSISLQKQ